MDIRVRTAITLIKSHPACKLTVRELARKVNLSHWHFSHLFLAELHISPSQFSRRLKFEIAKTLLESSFLSVKQIMAAVGMNDKSHFARDFKKIYGLSPREYRRQCATKCLVNQAAS